jgi:ATP phosphoribosyltransferase
LKVSNSKEELEKKSDALTERRTSNLGSNVDGPNSVPPGNLLFAVPKKGRIHTKIMEMIDGIGIRFARKPRLDVAHSTNMNISLVFLPCKDIATYVADGNVDLGITGEDIIAEHDAHDKTVVERKLEMGRCRLCLQAPVAVVNQPPSFFAGKRIVTSFPVLTKRFFDPLDAQLGTTTSIQCVSGSVEAACGLGLADAVVDLVETGTTMIAAGLDIVDTLLHTETVMISNPRTSHQRIIQQLLRRIDGYNTSNNYLLVGYNIPQTALEEASAITPGFQSPTVTQLAQEGWIAVSVLVPKKHLNIVMDRLHAIGGTGIIATKIHNCLF